MMTPELDLRNEQNDLIQIPASTQSREATN